MVSVGVIPRSPVLSPGCQHLWVLQVKWRAIGKVAPDALRAQRGVSAVASLYYLGIAARRVTCENCQSVVG